MTEKAVNYTPEQVTSMVQQYQAGTAVETIAAGLGKTVRSVVAKLSREGVYVKKERAAAGRTTKADLVSKIETMLGFEGGVLDSFEKASHVQLEAVASRLLDLQAG